MALEIKLAQKLSQSLLMTPQLQQAIKLLQLGRLEYKEAIEKELLENPILEELRDDGDQSKNAAPVPEEREHEEAPVSPQKDGSPIEWEDYLASFSDHRGSSLPKGSIDHEDRPSLEATLSKSQSLADHLVSQLCCSDFVGEQRQVLLHILGNLDKDGFLCVSDEEIAEACECDLESVQSVIETVQSLDPAGIAARNLEECLLLQLDRQGLRESLEAKIVQQHLPRLEKKQYDAIAKIEGVEVQTVYKAVTVIQQLEPRPGIQFSDDATRYITPDIYVYKDGGEYVISLNEDGLPKLRVSPYYLRLLHEEDHGGNNPGRAYLTERLKAASWLIKSIHQRQQTIYKVTESIVKFQREFLDHGIEQLRPLVLKDVADDIGMHESTVSRVTTNKYVHTPQGVFELKFFFTTGIKTDEGSVSSSSVKEKIRSIVAGETPSAPVSDQEIVEILKKENINIARRTVAKYRESMNILSSSKRKKVF